jgi:sugar (pentulose or hexulose) kinase
MEDRCIITVDIGTSSIRSVLFDETGRILHIDQRDNPPDYLDDGRVEQDPATWKLNLAGTLASCAATAARNSLTPAALGLTAQRSSVIPVDAEGGALHPAIMWQDTRTEGLCARMEADQAEVFRRSGLRIYPVFSAVKMRWFKEERPEVYNAAHKMLGIQDLLIHELTGLFVTDRSLASRTNLFNLDTLEWDDELIRRFGIDKRLLCSLVDPGGLAGTITAGMAAATGLPAGLPVVSAGGDQQCAALGLGLAGPGRVIANTGTGSYLIAGVDRPVIDPAMSIACNVAAVPGSYILEAGSPTAGSILRWFNREFHRDCSGGENDFSQLIAEAETSPPGANGVILLPHFKGRGAPRWDPGARGAFIGLSQASTRGDLARAILEGIAAELAENLEAVEALGGSADTIAVSGGMTASRLYCQLQADMYGRRVERPDETEATALGAWISCAVRLGLFPGFAEAHRTATEGRPGALFVPDPAATAVYRRIAQKRKRLYEAIRACDTREELP